MSTGKVRVKMELEFWYDPETNSYEPISSKVVEDSKKTATPIKAKKPDDGATALITLEENKLVFNEKALEVLNSSPDDRLSIKYQKVDGKMLPVIAKDEVFGTKGGNKLTKSGTISFRGKANEKLAEYGSEFTLTPKGDDEVFIMVGNVDPKPYKVVDKNIQVKESEDSHDLEDLVSVGLDTDLELEGAEEISFNVIL